MIVLKIQSFSDIITNSSSEIFTLKSDVSLDIVKSMILKKHESAPEAPEDYYKLSEEERNKYDTCTGMGGILEIKDWNDMYSQDREYSCVKSKQHLYTPEIWSLQYKESLDELKSMIWVDIDEGFKVTIDFIFENFWVSESTLLYWNGKNYFSYWQLDEIKRPIRAINKKMYDLLPEENKTIKI